MANNSRAVVAEINRRLKEVLYAHPTPPTAQQLQELRAILRADVEFDLLPPHVQRARRLDSARYAFREAMVNGLLGYCWACARGMDDVAGRMERYGFTKAEIRGDNCAKRREPEKKRVAKLLKILKP